MSNQTYTVEEDRTTIYETDSIRDALDFATHHKSNHPHTRVEVTSWFRNHDRTNPKEYEEGACMDVSREHTEWGGSRLVHLAKEVGVYDPEANEWE